MRHTHFFYLKMRDQSTDLKTYVSLLKGVAMNTKKSEPVFSETTDGELTMKVAEEILGNIFEEADNDSTYHKNVSLVRDDITHGKCSCNAEEVAESILAWSGAL